MSQTPPLLLAPTPPGYRVAPVTDIPRVDSVEACGQQIARHMSRCRRQGGQLTVLWVEAVLQAGPGDAWSPGALQSVMQSLARRLRNRVRCTDDVQQVGDDSFVVVLMEAGPAESALVEARLQYALRGSYGVDGLLMQADLKMGSATFPETGRSGADLAEKARQCCAAPPAAEPPEDGQPVVLALPA